MNVADVWRYGVLALIVGASAVAVSCDDALPTEPNEATVGPITAELVVEPVSVPPEGPTTATVLIRSSLDRDTTLVSTVSCIAFLHALRDGEKVALTGVDFPCLTIGRGFTVPAQGVFRESHAITAAIDGDPPRPAPRGDYVVEADVNVPGLPTLRHPLEVT